MALEATVYCNCMENNKLRSPPSESWSVYIDDSGARLPNSNSLELEEEFYRWNQGACEHDSNEILHHRLGNITAIAYLRDELSRFPERFEYILAKVIYDGTHIGDFVPVCELSKLENEISFLPNVHSDQEDVEFIIRSFEKKIGELVEIAKVLNKPISF